MPSVYIPHPRPKLTVAERWSRFVERGQDSQCWKWTGSIDSCGYGSMKIGGKTERAHRVSVLLATGESIPEGMHVDHMCRNRWCVNPAHLRVVTPRVNLTENSDGPAAKHARATHCSRGHEKTAENMYIRPNGGRWCRECKRLRQRSAWRNKKVAA